MFFLSPAKMVKCLGKWWKMVKSVEKRADVFFSLDLPLVFEQKNQKNKRDFFHFSRIFQEVKKTFVSLPEICKKNWKNVLFFFCLFFIFLGVKINCFFFTSWNMREKWAKILFLFFFYSKKPRDTRTPLFFLTLFTIFQKLSILVRG